MRDLKIAAYNKTLKKINALEPAVHNLTEAEMKAKTAYLKERVKEGKSLDDILPIAFAMVREAAKRTLGYGHYDVQMMGGIAMHQGCLAEMKTGEGKANPVYTPIPTPDGWKRVGDIREGDYLFDRTGNPTKVTGVFPQGKKEIYEVELLDGRVIECAAEHLWSVYRKYEPDKLVTVTTEQLFRHGARSGKVYYYSIPMAQAVQYPERKFSIDPYVMGAFLGGGCKNAYGSFEFSDAEGTAVDELNRLLGSVAAKRKGYYDYMWNFYLRYDPDYWRANKVLRIRDLDARYEDLLSNTVSSERYIPDEYKTASIEQRWALVQGLMDTDGNLYMHTGYSEGSCNMRFSTTSKRLCDDFMEVVYSLGFSCTVSSSKRKGASEARHLEYIVRINAPDTIKNRFFRFPKSKVSEILAQVTNRQYKQMRSGSKIVIADIRKTGRSAEQVCFTVDNPEHLFLVGKYVVTHNTLVATAPAYLNALTGEGVHVVTVNDYLASRDSEWMGQIYRYLGLTVGCVVSEMSMEERKRAYACDITYVTNNELGFDYLRDNMAVTRDNMVLRGLPFCIIDETDSVLIDEARTPLIISGQGNDVTKLYRLCDILVRQMVRGEEIKDGNGTDEDETGDYIADEENQTAVLTAEGVRKAEEFFGLENLADEQNTDIRHHIILAIRANCLMERDVDYIVKDGEVLIVDEFTGRIMEGRRYSDGLHQAIEAKEHVEIQSENQTMATITFQNFFNKYRKKCGMTGTAYTERREFQETYGMDVVRIPTNRPVIREDRPDKVFLTKEEKYKAVVREVCQAHKLDQPVLVGTASIETSELLSRLLTRKGIKHQVLNAKFDKEEAEIVEKAGEAGAVTIATNMAGRGTDIKLSETARQAGGLKVIGTERHESRRIDDQLRGRSGRQGDPGDSRFFLSLEDDLLKYNGNEKTAEAIRSAAKEGRSVWRRKLEQFVRRAQEKVEMDNYGVRESLLAYDTVDDRQREAVYGKRLEIIDGTDARDTAAEIVRGAAERKAMRDKLERKEVRLAAQKAEEEYRELAGKAGAVPGFNMQEKGICLRTIDSAWIRHLADMEKLKDIIHYQSIGMRNPAVEYRTEASRMFMEMMESAEDEAAAALTAMAERYAALKAGAEHAA